VVVAPHARQIVRPPKPAAPAAPPPPPIDTPPPPPEVKATGPTEVNPNGGNKPHRQIDPNNPYGK
jgi:hypothetical protein